MSLLLVGQELKLNLTLYPIIVYNIDSKRGLQIKTMHLRSEPFIGEIEQFYTKTVPRIDLKQVYEQVDNQWVQLKNARFNTGFILDHLSGSKILGYKFFNRISQALVLKTTDFPTVLAKVGEPSYAVTVKDTTWVHYRLNEKYYLQDLQASFVKKYGDLAQVVTDEIIPLPIGVNQKIAWPAKVLSTWTKPLNLPILESILNSKVFDLKSICPLIKTYFKYTQDNRLTGRLKDIKRIVHTKNLYPSIGFYDDNLSNSLFQIFNTYFGDKKAYLERCFQEVDRCCIWKKVDENLPEENRKNYFMSFYYYLADLKASMVYRTKHTDFIRTDLTSYQVFQIKRWLSRIPGYKGISIDGLKQSTAKTNFLNFSVKIINMFLQQKSPIYYMPSTLMKKLDRNYASFTKILFPAITQVLKEYSNFSTNYRCRGYDVKLAKKILSRVLKTKSINLSYYDLSTSYKYSHISKSMVYRSYRRNYYNIFPDQVRHRKTINGIMFQLGFTWVSMLPLEFRYAKKWCIIMHPLT